MRRERDQRMSPVSCARCMRTTLASASDGIVAAPGSPVDQQGLWRVEPQPDEWHRGSPGNLFNRSPVGRPRMNRIDDDAVACTEDERGLFRHGGVDAVRHLRGIGLPDRGAAREEHHTGASASRRCATRPHPGRRQSTVPA